MQLVSYTRHLVSWQPRRAAGDLDAVLEQIVRELCPPDFFEANPRLSHELIVEALLERERQGTTAVDQGIAFPHARLEHLDEPLLAFATFEEDVYFGGVPVRIVCLLLTPAAEASTSLRLMARLARLFSEAEMRHRFLGADQREALRALVEGHDTRDDQPIVAADIMRPPRYSVLEDQPVWQCARTLSEHRLVAIPVVDEQRHVLGEITAQGLFQYGLPEFFSKLKSVSFIAEFDPFEKYFADERNLHVRDVMDPKPRIVPGDYTLMEIVFDLAIGPYVKLYVVDADGRWIGEIDKSVVLDRVINH